MVRLNRNKLRKKQLDDLFWQFAVAVAPHDPMHANGVLNEILGTEERIMLAKRLTTVVLLVEGTSMYKVGTLLKLSPSTVEHIVRKIESGDFDHILTHVSKTKKDYFTLLEIIDSILHLGGILPHYNGLDRYKYLK